MKKLKLSAILIIFMTLASCSNLQNIRKESIRMNGEVIYSQPSYQYTRKVTLLTPSGLVIIYGVPIEQPLRDIPVCKYKGRYYWVMP